MGSAFAGDVIGGQAPLVPAARITTDTGHNLSGFRIGRIAGIDILIHPSWLLVFALLTWSLSEGLFLEENPDWDPAAGWAAGVATSLLFFSSILLHELSHSLVARRYGLDVRSITLFIFGGVSALKDEPKTPADELRIALVGPLTSFLLAALFAIAGVALWDTAVDSAAFYLALINALLGIFNLLPGFPLDGGRVLRATLWARSGSHLGATRTAAQVGGGIAFVLMGAGVVIAIAGAFLTGIWFVVIGWFLRSQADASYRELITRDVLESTSAISVMDSSYHAVHPSTTLDALVHEYVLHYHERYYPVSIDGDFRGLITLSDLSKFPREEWAQRTVSDAMTPFGNLHALTPADNLRRALELIAGTNVHQLPVVEESGLLGFVTRAGIMRVMQVHEEVGVPPSEPQRTSAGRQGW